MNSGVITLGFPSGTFMSGFSPPLQIVLSGSILSGHSRSGLFGNAPQVAPICGNIYIPPCDLCKGNLFREGHPTFSVIGSGFKHRIYCAICANYDISGQRFYTREDYIREDLPTWMEGFPSHVISDWLEEQNRLNDARYMRNLPPPSPMSES